MLARTDARALHESWCLPRYARTRVASSRGYFILFYKKEVSPGSATSHNHIFINFSAYNLKNREKNDLKELKVESIIASSSNLNKDIQGDNLQCLARQTKSSLYPSHAVAGTKSQLVQMR